jgi:hypothetical protein
MSKEEILDLIAELKQLKLRESQVLISLESAIQRQNEPTPNAQTAVSPDTTVRPPTFRVGDQVTITNKVKRPINRPLNRGDLTAVVLKVAPSRVDIRTSNGTTTWRAPHNLRQRQQDE